MPLQHTRVTIDVGTIDMLLAPSGCHVLLFVNVSKLEISFEMDYASLVSSLHSGNNIALSCYGFHP